MVKYFGCLQKNHVCILKDFSHKAFLFLFLSVDLTAPDIKDIHTETDTYSNTHSTQTANCSNFSLSEQQESEHNLFASSFLFPTERSFCEAPGSAAQLAAHRPLHVQSEYTVNTKTCNYFCNKFSGGL